MSIIITAVISITSDIMLKTTINNKEVIEFYGLAQNKYSKSKYYDKYTLLKITSWGDEEMNIISTIKRFMNKGTSFFVSGEVIGLSCYKNKDNKDSSCVNMRLDSISFMPNLSKNTQDISNSNNNNENSIENTHKNAEKSFDKLGSYHNSVNDEF